MTADTETATFLTHPPQHLATVTPRTGGPSRRPRRFLHGTSTSSAPCCAHGVRRRRRSRRRCAECRRSAIPRTTDLDRRSRRMATGAPPGNWSPAAAPATVTASASPLSSSAWRLERRTTSLTTVALGVRLVQRRRVHGVGDIRSTLTRASLSRARFTNDDLRNHDHVPAIATATVIVAGGIADLGRRSTGGYRISSRPARASSSCSGVNSYTGTTTVGAGALIVNGNSSTSSHNLTAASSAAVGTVGPLTATGGAVSPGDAGLACSRSTARSSMSAGSSLRG